MKILKRIFKTPNWRNLRTTQPLSRIFGIDRGTPIDRYYIEKFLFENSHLITGRVLEIGSNLYTKKFGVGVSTSEVLHYTEGNPDATIIGDLTNRETLPHEFADCFVCTQTLNFIFDFQKAIENIHFVLKKDGVALVTIAGLCQISRYDMDRWGDYWRFTTASALKSFGKIFGEENIDVQSYGNVLSSISLMHGIAAEELTKDEITLKDADYQIIITVRATKC